MRKPLGTSVITGKAKVRISMPLNNRDSDNINIIVEDAESGTLVADIEVTAEDFTKMAVGNRVVDADATWRPDLLGFRSETKREQVPIETGIRSGRGNRSFADPADRARLYGPFEVDGWVGDDDDYFNHHRRAGNGKTATVIFRRFVNIETGEPYIPDSQLVWPEPAGDFKDSARLAAEAAKERDDEFFAAG